MPLFLWKTRSLCPDGLWACQCLFQANKTCFCCDTGCQVAWSKSLGFKECVDHFSSFVCNTGTLVCRVLWLVFYVSGFGHMPRIPARLIAIRWILMDMMSLLGAVTLQLCNSSQNTIVYSLLHVNTWNNQKLMQSVFEWHIMNPMWVCAFQLMWVRP